MTDEKDLKDFKKDFKRLPCQERACRSCITERSCTSELPGESFLWCSPYKCIFRLAADAGRSGARGQQGRLYPILFLWPRLVQSGDLQF